MDERVERLKGAQAEFLGCAEVAHEAEHKVGLRERELADAANEAQEARKLRAEALAKVVAAEIALGIRRPA